MALALAAALVLATAGCRQTTAAADATTSRPAAQIEPRSASTTSAEPQRAAIVVRLTRLRDGADPLSFGLPLLPGAAADTSAIHVFVAGASGSSSGLTPIDAHIKPLLREHDANGEPRGLRAVLIQLPGALMKESTLDVTVTTQGTGRLPPSDVTPYVELSAAAPEVARVVDRTIVRDGDTYRIQESGARTVPLFAGREPRVLPSYPPGYLAATGILGRIGTAAEVATDDDRAGLRYLSEALLPFVRSALYEEPYALNPDPASVVDPVANFEGWLYDRCATLLIAHAHTGDADVLRHALRSCSYYASQIALDGRHAGTFRGKPEPDPKYSHLRGLYAYYALTGDESALGAGQAIARMWLGDALFVAPYRAGRLRGPDKLWTERLLGTSLEALYYGHRLTGDKACFTAFKEMLDTAWRHLTLTDPAQLASLTADPNRPPLPPQSCFIHNAAQHGEGASDVPWCSGWMSELIVDPLLAWQEQTGDGRVDEIFIRLARALRDVGTAYFDANPLDDRFLSPSVCYDVARGVDVRRLVPLYGAGLRADGKRVNSGEFADFEHCTDATALTAAALRALRRTGGFDKGGPIGPFASEGAALLAMHHELSACARLDFEGWSRAGRDPATWTSAALQAGAADPAKFLFDNRVGFPSHPSAPQRKLSWWFNTSLVQYALLREAGVRVPVLQPGAVQPADRRCPRK